MQIPETSKCALCCRNMCKCNNSCLEFCCWIRLCHSSVIYCLLLVSSFQFYSEISTKEIVPLHVYFTNIHVGMGLSSFICSFDCFTSGICLTVSVPKWYLHCLKTDFKLVCFDWFCLYFILYTYQVSILFQKKRV